MNDSVCKGCENRSLECRKTCLKWARHEILRLRSYEEKQKRIQSAPSNMGMQKAYAKKLMKQKQRGGSSQ